MAGAAISQALVGLGDRREEEAARQEEERQQRRERAVAAARSSPADESADKTKSKLKPGDPGFRWHAEVPQPARLDYSKRPSGLVAADPAGMRKGGGKTGKDKMMKKLQDIGRRGKESGKASRVSVQGRDLIMTK